MPQAEEVVGSPQRERRTDNPVFKELRVCAE
jgi:hypothetical protein